VSTGLGLFLGYPDDKRSVAFPDGLFDTLTAGIYFFRYNYHYPVSYEYRGKCYMIASYQEFLSELFQLTLTETQSRIKSGGGYLSWWFIGAGGFEPPTSASRTRRATRLRYAPPTLL
jgi:hypothetical protein